MPLELTEELVNQFASLFKGNPYFRTVIRVGATNPSGKTASDALTISEPVTVDTYRNHLEGKERYGCILMQMDQKVSFGAIDLDVYGDAVYIADILKWVDHLKLPLVPCRTKSGGLHLYLFLTEPTLASSVRAVLASIAAELGVVNYKGKDAEIFPKEDKVDFIENGRGSNITLPYFNALDLESNTYMISNRLDRLDLRTFIKYAHDRRTSVALVESILKRSKADAGDLLTGAPPCLHSVFSLIKSGHQSGRNDMLRQFTAYFQKRYGEYELWADAVRQFNSTYFDEPLTEKELQSTVLRDKPQHYTCTKAPFAAHCNRGACLQESYGIRQSHGDILKIYYIEKVLTDPVIWRLETSSGKLALTTTQLDNFGEFRKACMEQLSFRPNFQAKDYAGLLDVAMQTVNHVIPPDEMSKFFPILDALREYFYSMSINGVLSTNLADLVRNRPVLDEGKREVLFMSEEFLRFKNRKKAVAVQEMFEFNKQYEITMRLIDLSHLNLSVPVRCSAISYTHVESYLTDRQERQALALKIGQSELEKEIQAGERRAF